MNTRRSLSTVSVRYLLVSLACLCAVSSPAQTVTKLNNVTNPVQDSVTASSDGRMGLGSNGTGDDVAVYVSNVLKDDDGTYKTWYGGHDGANIRTYYATSPDGLVWTKCTNAIPANSNTNSTFGRIPRGIGAGTGDTTHAYAAWVIKDGGVYKAWYGGYDGSAYRIFYATSPDGLTWTKYQNANPTNSNSSGTEGRIPLGTNGGDTVGVMFPCVIKDGTVYKMWYAAYGADAKYRIYHATSSNGLDWAKLDNSIPTNSNSVGNNGRIPLGVTGGDTSQAFAPGVVKTATGFRMWYTGHDGATYRIYHATSSNGLDWLKVMNGIPTPTNTTVTGGRIACGTAGRGDASGIYRAVPLLETGSAYRLWYMGSDGSWRIYYATMERDRPVVTNVAVVSVAGGSVDLGMEVVRNESDPVNLVVYWGLTNGGTNAASWATNADWGVTSSGIFTNTISGLAAGTRYYVNVCATNGLGTCWAGPGMSFSTLGAPSVNNAGGATNVSSTYATLRGEVTGGNPAPYVYIYWGTTNQGTNRLSWQHEEPIGVVSNWTLSLDVTVSNGQTYYYRCYASNSYDQVWSTVASFDTPDSVARTWTGAGTGVWTSTTNWIPSGTPGPHDTVTVGAGANVLFTNGATVGSLTMTGGTLTFGGTNSALRAAEVTIGGTVTHLPNTATNAPWTMDNRIWIVCSNLTVTGQINANEKGYQGTTNVGRGPGGASNTGGVPAYGGGGGHGGVGGNSLLYMSKQGIGGGSYGSAAAPDTPGSSGGGAYTTTVPSGSGGGVIHIDANGVVRIDGTVSADGAAAPYDAGQSRYWVGPGAGGSIFIQCHRFAGSSAGHVTAAAGYGGGSVGGAGGGRIAVYFDEAEPGAGVVFNANLSTALTAGGLGSLFLSDLAVLNSPVTNCYGLVYGPTNLFRDTLTVSNSTLLFQNTGFDLAITNALQVGPGASLSFDVSNRTAQIGSLTLFTNSVLAFQSGPTNAAGVYTNCGSRAIVTGLVDVAGGGILRTYCDPVNGGAVLLSLRDLNVETGGVVESPGGYYGGTAGWPTNGLGPGGGRGNGTTGYTGGGGHGGKGGTGAGNAAAFQGNTNGIMQGPLGCGSGGGANLANRGGRGGGLVWITTSGSLTVDGTISADGPDATGSGTLGGGSGGGVYIVSEVAINGSGLITAEGGDSLWGFGPGGGGRIALYSRADNFGGAFSTANGLSRNGASINAYSATTGSIHRAVLAGLLTLTVTGDPVEPGVSSPCDYGSYGVVGGLALTNSVTSPAGEADGVRYVCLGWTLKETGSGTPVGSGGTTQAVFTISTNTTLTWLWTNQFYLVATAACHGALTAGQSDWYTNGVSVTLDATPDIDYYFSQWSGTVPAGSVRTRSLTLTMDRPRVIQANFAANTAEAKTWSGGGDWFGNYSNWSPAGAPGTGDTVVVQAGTATLACATSVGYVEVRGRLEMLGPVYQSLVSVGQDLVVTGAAARVVMSNTFFSTGGSLVLASGADLEVYGVSTNSTGAEYGALVSVAGDIVLGSNSWVYPYSDLTNGGSAKFTARTLTVAQGGGFDASAKGYYGGGRTPIIPSGWQGQRGGGTGGGAGNTVQGYAGGGGYGGLGGSGAYNGLAQQGSSYGNSNRPVQCGSGGGGTASASGGRGGGLIWIEATGPVTLHGTFDANGQVTYGGLNAGAGSGGGIYINASSLRGGATGVIRADGGNASWASGAGGGGRIAIVSAVRYAYQGTISATNGWTTDGSQYRPYDVQPGTVVWIVPTGTMYMMR